jgi:FlaA1/EpsC-like NDP-sugar epimerase
VNDRAKGLNSLQSAVNGLPSSLGGRLSRVAKRYILWSAIDALVVAVSLLLAWSARSITVDLDIRSALPFGLASIGVCWVVNYFFRLYHRVWHYASAGEIVVIAAAVVISTILLTLADIFWPGQRPVPLSVVLMMGFFCFVGFVSVRYRRRVWTGFHWRWRALWGRFPPSQRRVLIVGAGEAGQLLAWRFQNQKEGEGYHLVGFVDDDPNKQGMYIHGLPILGNRYAIPDLVARHSIDLIILAMYNISGEDFRAILDICLETPAVVKTLPNIFDFIRGTNGSPLVRDITAEDLLGRKPVEIDLNQCRNLLMGKTVMVTGGGGSIGSELCRQILSFHPRLLLIVDNNESGLYDLTQDLLSEAKDKQFIIKSIVGDITNEREMRSVFESYRPQVVFHAAAYKHVPLMEEYPDRAVRVNIVGTKIVASMASQYGAEIFVLISTDKAANPRSVMGATKRICEMMVLSTRAGSSRSTKFTAVRFGNVLGSRGSVVPLFERQIARGGPVTITHPEMTRYFMSTSEAVSLIIQAAALTEGGDIFLLDMGQQIRIEDLARRLIRLRGLRPGIDIPIVYIGSRPGEKMSEELLNDGETCIPTSHPHIFRVNSNCVPDRDGLWRQIDELIALAEAQCNDELVRRLLEVANSPL